MDINRKTALDVLVDVEKHQAYSNLALNNFIEKNNCDNPAFVREIVYGVLKNKTLLDYVLRVFVEKGFAKLKPVDISLLRMGAYQLLFMESVPEYAAVSETVELAKHFARGRERFINGVLRSVIREREDIVFPSKDDDPFKYLAVRYSCEYWIADLLIESFGFKGAEDYLRACNETPDLSIRVNTLKTTRDELFERLKEKGFDVKKSEKTKRGLLVTGTGVLSTDEFKEGLFSVQDEASILAIEVLDPKPGEVVCDTCAAPGGKTVSICEMMENKGRVYAFDVYDNKLGLIKEHLDKNGINIVRLEAHDGQKQYKELSEKCDKVLCDVPCSGLGVLRRKPEIKYKNEVDIQLLIKKQWSILNNAATYVKPGGVLMYSTCTVNPKENQEQTDRFIENNQSFRKESEKTLLCQEGTDGFYICKMIKEG